MREGGVQAEWALDLFGLLQKQLLMLDVVLCSASIRVFPGTIHVLAVEQVTVAWFKPLLERRCLAGVVWVGLGEL